MQGTRLINFFAILSFTLIVLVLITLAFSSDTRIILANSDAIVVLPGQGIAFEQVDFVFSGFA